MGEKRGKIEREKEIGKDRRNSKERGSHFSLDFPVIGPSNPDETRGKVGPHYKSFPWVLVLRSFDNSGR